MDDTQVKALERWMQGTLGTAVAITGVSPLQGGSIQENWRVTCRIDGAPETLVLRRDAPATINTSRSRQEEFALLEAAYAVGVRVPRPVGACADRGVIGVPFFLMQWLDGVGIGTRIVKDLSLGGDRMLLGEQLGRELAKIHGIAAPEGKLDFLGPRRSPDVIAALRATLDALGVKRPALEWGLRWAESNAPRPTSPVLLHNDYRTGNYLVDQHGLAAILDWEFAGWGEAMADLGWFCAECWRFGRNDLEAGGIAPRAAFYAGYESVSGAEVDDEAVRYWEIVAHLRWAVIALEQAQRHLSGREPSLELALTGRIVPELELAVLRTTPPSAWSLRDAG